MSQYIPVQQCWHEHEPPEESISQVPLLQEKVLSLEPLHLTLEYVQNRPANPSGQEQVKESYGPFVYDWPSTHVPPFSQ